jgi:S-adenosylmethionine:tRNA ribosyltransferase-isomerase
MELHALFYGGGFSRIERDVLGRPIWLWLLDARRMAPRLVDNGRRLEWVYKNKDYQETVYRDEDKAGSAAAPTAGLHFDEATLLALSEKGVRLTKVTLHVGPGTFLPVHSDRLSQHKMHPEPWWMSTPAAAALNEARATNKRIVAVGTTAARVLESARLAWAGKDDVVFGAGRGLTRLFIKPGHEVLAFDALLTNFHLPESTLLVLVGTLVGRRRILAAYNDAVAHGYRFYSYGDCCFIER